MMFRTGFCSFTYLYIYCLGLTQESDEWGEFLLLHWLLLSSGPGTVEAASLCVSCCIPAEQVSSNLLQNILFETFCVAGAHFKLVCCVGMHI